MRVTYADHHVVVLPEKHRFPMHKYALLRERLLETGVLRQDEVREAPLASRDEACLAHDPDYVDAFLAGTLPRSVQQRIGFPWSEAMLGRTLSSLGGTLLAAENALRDGVAGNLAGGTHHAHREAGSGYCVFNDLACASLRLLDSGKVRRVLVVDLDVHQGDGTAAIFAGDDRVFTLSLHGAKNFPGRKQESNLDVPLPDGTTDEAYLDALRPALETALDRSRPDLILYQGGVDPLAEDKLGRLALTHEGLYARDVHVFERARTLGLPVALTLGGGYANPIEPTVEANVGTYRAAKSILEDA